LRVCGAICVVRYSLTTRARLGVLHTRHRVADGAPGRLGRRTKPGKTGSGGPRFQTARRDPGATSTNVFGSQSALRGSSSVTRPLLSQPSWWPDVPAETPFVGCATVLSHSVPMNSTRAYHRPTTLVEALDLMARPDCVTTPLAGGTALNGATGRSAEEMIDLQALGLSAIWRDGELLEVGSMATLRDLVDHESTPPLLRDLARREAPNTIRNAATIGGTVAGAHSESGLVAGLLAYSATVGIARVSGSEEVALETLIEDGGRLGSGLITWIRFATTGYGAFEATARTPADTPIVLVAGHRSEEGVFRLAATGVSLTPVLVDPDRLDQLDPPPDFRGSARYRSNLVGVLVERVLGRLREGGVS